VQSDALVAYHDGVAIDDAGLAGQLGGGGSKWEECRQGDGGQQD